MENKPNSLVILLFKINFFFSNNYLREYYTFFHLFLVLKLCVFITKVIKNEANFRYVQKVKIKTLIDIPRMKKIQIQSLL